MSKTARETLAKRVQNELLAYFKAGSPINQDEVARALDGTGLEIHDFDRLLRIRFALSEPVQTYVANLPERLRSVRTESTVTRQATRGEIRGAIDWGQTLRQRYAENPADRSRFITQTPQTEYQLPENLLLKTLLSIIAETARNELLDIDYSWRRTQWSDGDIRQFLRRVDQNVHLDRIEANAETLVPNQALDQARQSRQPLYYEGYELYRLLEDLQQRNFDSDGAAQLLFETLILPSTATLFELAVVFKLLSRFTADAGVSLQSIERGESSIAIIRNDSWEYHVYHDKTGNLRFHEAIPRSTGIPFLERSQRALEHHKIAMNHDSLRPVLQGRPDIVIEKYRSGETASPPEQVLLGEVKHSDKKGKLSDGLYDITRYLEFAKPDMGSQINWETETYLIDRSDVSITGLVVTDGVDFEPAVDDLEFQHMNYEDLSGLAPDQIFSSPNTTR